VSILHSLAHRRHQSDDYYLTRNDLSDSPAHKITRNALRSSESPAHKLTGNVLHTLSVICAESQEGARAAVDANALGHSLRLLGSPSPSVICAACRVMAEIARHESLNAAVLQLNPCMRLVSLLVMK
jgi:hypothetical protein